MLICESCFAKPARPGAVVSESARLIVCAEGCATAGQAAADALHCECCGHPVHVDPVTRVWFGH